MNNYLLMYEVKTEGGQHYMLTQRVKKTNEFREIEVKLFEDRMEESLLRKYNEKCDVTLLAFSKFGE